MARKILIAFDDSKNAMRAVDFVGTHLSPDSEVTLFNVLQDTEALCAMQSPELTPYFLEQQTHFCSLDNKKKELVEQALQDARRRLVDCGFDGSSITIKAEKQERGIARDIIKEANSGGYDLVVLGKKGLSGIKEFFIGSISQKVMHGVKDTSVLLVD